jgi:hypothetical protein
MVQAPYHSRAPGNRSAKPSRTNPGSASAEAALNFDNQVVEDDRDLSLIT